ncbi:MAG TPA: FAD-dependent monooxygenase, partial [Methyloceanibacter sp.]|nr:FAD-dependent monooxygenase [Methyloceanibacter sp.]
MSAPRRQGRPAKRPVLIAGGGIGGLATAIALGRRGLGATVLDRSSFGDETGAGIQLGPNATRALAELGVIKAISSAAFTPEAIWLFDGLSGRRLASLPLGASAKERFGAPYLTLHRADLHAGLLAACQELATVTIRPWFAVAAVEERDGRVVARTADGGEAKGRYLIGADGLWSNVRSLIAPEAKLRFAGTTAWRTILPRSRLP